MVEAVAFAVASIIHGGHVIPGYGHRNAYIAEAVLAIALFGGVVITVLAPERARRSGLLAQGFALLGTLVGLVTIAVGVGPRTLPDVIYHIAMVVLLIGGLRYTQGGAALRPPQV
jgi:peptidoglycan/LPS O-acetylase OafA/YrhL